jgi:hypothetical protein
MNISKQRKQLWVGLEKVSSALCKHSIEVGIRREIWNEVCSPSRRWSSEADTSDIADLLVQAAAVYQTVFADQFRSTWEPELSVVPGEAAAQDGTSSDEDEEVDAGADGEEGEPLPGLLGEAEADLFPAEGSAQWSSLFGVTLEMTFV